MKLLNCAFISPLSLSSQNKICSSHTNSVSSYNQNVLEPLPDRFQLEKERVRVVSPNIVEIYDPSKKISLRDKVAEALNPKSTRVKAILADIISDSVLLDNSGAIYKRHSLAQKADDGFQIETQKLIDQGIITPNSFVISDTGHDIPVFAQLLKNTKLKAQGGFHFDKLPGKPDIGSYKRIPTQAYIYGKQIRDGQLKNKDESGVLFLGLETHRLPPACKEIPPMCTAIKLETFPNAGDLKELGIKEIVYLKEATPDMDFELNDFAKIDVKPYLLTLEKMGFKVICKGVDPRRAHKKRASN